jgi:hypothetical protein
MRYPVIARRFSIIGLASWSQMVIACMSTYEPFTQPSPTSVNQEFMLGEVQRFTPMLNIGEFVATFTTPPAATYAGWADCKLSGNPPWYLHFNKDYVEGLDPIAKQSYMSALVAHEMCHHWVTRHNVSCYDEVEAELCAYNLVALGRPSRTP